MKASNHLPASTRFLYCVSGYPAPYSEFDLTESEGYDGISDHTIGIEIPIAAAVLGAEIIEKHFFLEDSPPGPDRVVGLNEDGLARMVEAVRHVEQARGDGVKRCQPCEKKNLKLRNRAK